MHVHRWTVPYGDKNPTHVFFQVDTQRGVYNNHARIDRPEEILNSWASAIKKARSKDG